MKSVKFWSVALNMIVFLGASWLFTKSVSLVEHIVWISLAVATALDIVFTIREVW